MDSSENITRTETSRDFIFSKTHPMSTNKNPVVFQIHHLQLPDVNVRCTDEICNLSYFPANLSLIFKRFSIIEPRILNSFSSFSIDFCSDILTVFLKSSCNFSRILLSGCLRTRIFCAWTWKFSSIFCKMQILKKQFTTSRHVVLIHWTPISSQTMT